MRRYPGFRVDLILGLFVSALAMGCGATADDGSEPVDTVSEALCTGVKLTNATATPLPSGSSASLTAINTSCALGETAEFRFLHRRQGASVYTVFREWSPDPTASFDNTGLGSGKYTLLVRARHVGSGASQESASSLMILSGNVCTAVSLTPSPLGPKPPGTAITLTPTPTCTEGAAEYLYQVKPPGSTYADLTSWISTDTIWSTGGLAPGIYSIRVYARGAGNPTTPYESSKTISYTLADSCKPASLSTLPASPATVGTAVTINGGAPCLAGATPELRFSYRLKGTLTYTVLQNYSTDADFIWNTAGLAPGVYQLKVDSRAPGLTGAQSSKVVNYTLTAPIVTFNGLGVPPSGEQDGVYALSGDGLTGGGYLFGVGGTTLQAVLWTAAGGLTPLGPLEPFSAAVYGLSFDGSVAVGASNGGAFRWTQATGMVAMTPFAGGSSCVALGMNGEGSVATGRCFVGGAIHAFHWSEGTGMIDLGIPAPSFPHSFGFGVSADGTAIAGLAYDASFSAPTGMRWRAGVGLELLGTLPGGNYCELHDITGDGNVIVGGSNSGASNRLAPVRWTEADGFIPVLLPAGATSGIFYATNPDGSVAVGYSEGDIYPRAIMWDSVHGVRFVADVLTAAGIDLTGWSLESAEEVSDDGKVIGGLGVNSVTNQREGWVARVP
jgi:hypothetical protein